MTFPISLLFLKKTRMENFIRIHARKWRELENVNGIKSQKYRLRGLNEQQIKDD